jgi:hypothetical protein
MDRNPGVTPDDEWVAQATEARPVETSERRKRTSMPPGAQAQRAMALALLGVVCFGFVFGPMALARSRRARLALIDAPHLGGAGTAHRAMVLGKAGLALHLTIAGAALPWLLFMLSRLGDG